MTWEMEGLDDLILNLLGHSVQSFNFSRMLHNVLRLRTNAVLIERAHTKKSPVPYPNNLFLLETQECEANGS
jgi:hypothetical protein